MDCRPNEPTFCIAPERALNEPGGEGEDPAHKYSKTGASVKRKQTAKTQHKAAIAGPACAVVAAAIL